ncbi:hypothetical protein V6N13_093270 [Hibiscus sabdariffa]|uniref:Uncharacterized protein n=1 Tax=Hibiscus sabdariffa TaxID=183260 RepID=A0ABR2C9X1_9ROSI
MCVPLVVDRVQSSLFWFIAIQRGMRVVCAFFVKARWPIEGLGADFDYLIAVKTGCWWPYPEKIENLTLRFEDAHFFLVPGLSIAMAEFLDKVAMLCLTYS